MCLGRRGNAYLKNKIVDFNDTAKAQPFLVLTDLDGLAMCHLGYHVNSFKGSVLWSPRRIFDIGDDIKLCGAAWGIYAKVLSSDRDRRRCAVNGVFNCQPTFLNYLRINTDGTTEEEAPWFCQGASRVPGDFVDVQFFTPNS